jgi:hypothetical protein
MPKKVTFDLVMGVVTRDFTESCQLFSFEKLRLQIAVLTDN